VAAKQTGSLATTQHELARLICAPDEIRAEDLDWLRGDRSVGARERLAVYANAYFARIHDALREDYGALHAALGDGGFRDLARLYLMAHPPSAFSLRFAGEQLPAFLAGPIGEPFLQRWPFAAALAALEWAIADVFDAPDDPSLTREALAALPPSAWQEIRFELIGAQRSLELGWPVHRVREAWDADRTPPRLEPEPTRLLIYRTGEEVLHRAVSDAEAHALAALRDGCDFGEVCARVALCTGEAQAPARAVAMLERWLADGILLQLRT
jgi:hypothetical protein